MKNEYSAHPWAVDVEVYFADGWEPRTDLTDAELVMYRDAIKATLKGDFYIGIQDNMIDFWADGADAEKLHAILDELEQRGCYCDYPDWYYINEVACPE